MAMEIWRGVVQGSAYAAKASFTDFRRDGARGSRSKAESHYDAVGLAIERFDDAAS